MTDDILRDTDRTKSNREWPFKITSMKQRYNVNYDCFSANATS